MIRMSKRAAVQCRACGQIYPAQIDKDEIILPTDDGNCRCGEFAPV